VPGPGNAIRCVIVDDHRLLLDLLVDAVTGIPGLTVVATATDVTEADRPPTACSSPRGVHHVA